MSFLENSLLLCCSSNKDRLSYLAALGILDSENNSAELEALRLQAGNKSMLHKLAQHIGLPLDASAAEQLKFF